MYLLLQPLMSVVSNLVAFASLAAVLSFVCQFRLHCLIKMGKCYENVWTIIIQIESETVTCKSAISFAVSSRDLLTVSF